MSTQRATGRASRSDAADLQRLIRYVERWRMSHFQRADASTADGRMADADALLRKLRSGMHLAAEASRSMASQSGPAYVY